MKNKVAAIVVTYNRKEFLVECLKALLNQTRPVDSIYILDNASTDGTPEYLLEKGFIDKVLCSYKEPLETVSIIKSRLLPDIPIEVHYVRMHENLGGAGGFYEGIKRGYDAGFDWLWLMDDDGYPAKDQLFELLDKSIKNELYFSGPVVIDRDNEQMLAFRSSAIYNVTDTVEHIKTQAKKDIVYNCIYPFNGTLVSRGVVDKIGNIKKEMFIWGDEKEYVLRAEFNNIQIGTIITAVHWHPAREGNRVKVLFDFLGKVAVRTDSNATIYYRNLGYQHAKYFGARKQIKTLIKHTVYFLVNLKFNIKGLKDFYRYYFDGATDRYCLPPKRK